MLLSEVVIMKLRCISTTAALSLLLLGPAGAQQEIPKPASQAGYNKLIFSDDFTSLDLSQDRVSQHRWFNGMWFEHPARPGFIQAKGGILSLKTDQTRKNGTSITTFSDKRGAGTLFRYGYFEARMRWNGDPRAWVAFWLFSSQHAREIDSNHWCEIDIFESFRKDVFVGTVHDWRDFKTKKNANSWHPLPPRSIRARQWNTYGLLWTPRTITWYLNGKELFSASTPHICTQQDLFLVLGIQRRGNDKQQNLLVDWVRVFSK